MYFITKLIMLTYAELDKKSTHCANRRDILIFSVLLYIVHVYMYSVYMKSIE